ncbi:MAG: hypothetical protein NTZ35_01990 [Ignavibacteriales bacterium]|nr:hypothetical protein [Ignavibacteriales bacterium]
MGHLPSTDFYASVEGNPCSPKEAEMSLFRYSIILAIFASTICRAQNNPAIKGTWSTSGLEIESIKAIPVYVCPLDDATKDFGLTAERIRTKCDFKVRQMHLEPVDFKVTYPPQPYQLMVSVQINRISFLVEIHFLRRVSYKVGKRDFEMYATTWSQNIFGSHGSDSDYVLSALEAIMEEFLNAYVKANQN